MTYTITQADKDEILDIPNKILPSDALVQIKTFPYRAVEEGIAKGLEPVAIGNLVYDEICKLEIRKYTDIQFDSIRNYALFIQAAVQKKLETCKVGA